ncbi:MFS transporter [Photobacterium sp. TY1-4]|uniref:MFS transporter n=1 Tax=Photobacterium sp. TY1-4 TaxID=2899122 RepID=UPI0021C19AEA|nr:MFS transporter [Photobacterium sp. TY1-4]UXI03043.1 MFS transporter [Photobacterium sp. TY1-4]
MKNIPVIIEFFTKMASAIFTLVLGKLLFDQTNSLWAFATAYGGEFLIVTLIQLYAGSIADRYSPAKILIAINTLSLTAFGFLAATYEMSATLSLLLAAGMVYVSRPFYRTALFVLVRDVASESEFKLVNGRIASASQLGQIIGLSLTGLFLSWYSHAAVFYLMDLIYGICLLLSLFLYVRISGQGKPVQREVSDPLHWRDFFHFAGRDRAFAVRLVSSFSIAVSLGGFYVLLAPLVAAKFGDDTTWLSWLSVSYATGAIVSGILMKQLSQRFKEQSSDRRLLLNQMLSAFAFFCYGYFDQLVWLPLLLFCFGVSTTLAAVSLSSFLQVRTLSGVAGRTAAIQNIVIAAGNTFVAFYCSWLFERSFSTAAMGLAALLFILMLGFGVMFRAWPESLEPADKTLVAAKS